VLFAGLVRALVAGALEDERDGVPPPADPSELLAANAWWAARHGLTSTLCDPGEGRQREAAAVVGDLVERTSTELARSGDRDTVERGVDRLLRLGTPAERQRTAFRREGVPGVLSMITNDW
jgi:carboxylate-amine ligase